MKKRFKSENSYLQKTTSPDVFVHQGLFMGLNFYFLMIILCVSTVLPVFMLRK